MARVLIDWPEQILFRTEMPVRVSDINYGNHLGHDALVSMLHEARLRFLHSLAMSELDADGLVMLVADLAVRYLAEAMHGDSLGIEIGAGEVRSRSCELLYRVVRNSADRSEVPVALAKTGIVFVDPAIRKPAAIPTALRRLLVGS